MSSPEPISSSDGAPIRLLIADDHPVVRDGLSSMFARDPGFEVLGEACDGAEAVRLAQALEPDVILMDLRMPGQDGHAALAAIRSRPGPNQHMPVLAFSADGMLDAAGAARAGFQGVIRKPTSPGDLMRALAAAANADTAIEEGLRYAAVS